MSEPHVNVIVVSYNTRELTLACLRSVYEQTTGLPFEVIVLDNASTDGSVDAIAVEFPQVKLVALDENVGFGRGNNLAAREGRGEFILLLNSDTVILDRAIENLVAFARLNPTAGIFGGRTVFADGSLNHTSCHGRPTPWSMLCMGLGLSSLFRRSRICDRESMGGWMRDTVREVDAVTGCFLLIRRSLWEELDGFDPQFFMYGEETDLCLRAWKSGSRCVVCPDAVLVHYGGRSERARADKLVKLFNAKRRLFEKHWPASSRWFGTAMLRSWALTRMGAKRVLGLIRPSYSAGYEVWREVWRRRAEWQGA